MDPFPLAHLRSCVPFRNQPPRETVPEPNLLIRRPSSTGQYAPLVRTPRYCFDGRTVLPKPPRRPSIRSAPYKQLIVVPARRELVGIRIPLEPAHFLLVVAGKSADVLVWNADVSMEDGPIARAGREDMAVPCQRADAGGMARHGSDTLAVLGVPDLDGAAVGADRECGSLNYQLKPYRPLRREAASSLYLSIPDPSPHR